MQNTEELITVQFMKKTERTASRNPAQWTVKCGVGTAGMPAPQLAVGVLGYALAV
jgi:hypothetical protein